jgi:SAM-dependent methyltransferase
MEAKQSENQLTDHNFWANYWESKTGLITYIKPDFLFADLFKKIFAKNDIKTAVELGGFPGYYSIFLKKYLQTKTTLVDFFIHPRIFEELVRFNDLQPEDINVIQADLFNSTPKEKFDLVLSCGLIEHFNDTKDIIERHVPFIDSDGVLLISLPNFRGVNGWFQRNFDRYNYDKHNINSMDPVLLKKIFKELGFNNIECGYYGKFSVWLENYNDQSILVKILMKSVWLTGKLITKTLNFESRLFSPYIVISGNKA